MEYPAGTPRWRRYLRFWRRDVARDIDDELRFHFESRVEELVAQGATVDAARAQALAEFGDVAGVRRGLRAIDERVARRQRRGAWVEGVADDLRFAVRSLARTPGVAAAIVCTLVLGLGVNAAMFSLLETIYLRPPAGIAAPNGVRRVWRTFVFAQQGITFEPTFSYPEYQAVARALGDSAVTAAYGQPWPTAVGLGAARVKREVSYASADYFTLLGVHAERGRLYSPTEDRFDAPAFVAVASDAYWRSALGADSSVIGRIIVVAGRQFTLIGVTSKGFSGVDLDATDIWLPYAAQPAMGGAEWWKENNSIATNILARLAPAASDRSLAARITATLDRPEYRLRPSDSTVTAAFGAINLARGPGSDSQEVQISLRLAGVALLVLLIACANVMSLLLARASRRQREIAVRLALGISRARLLRLLLVESACLAVVAAVATLIVGAWGGALARRLLLPAVHEWPTPAVDWRVAAGVLVISLGAALVAGLPPAFQAASLDVADALRSGRAVVAARSSLRSVLVAAQAALSVVLLAGAVLFVRSLDNVRGLDLGFQPDRIVVAAADYDWPESNDLATLNRVQQVMADLNARVAALPGVEHVARTNIQPMGGFSWMATFDEQGDSTSTRGASFLTYNLVTPDYFATTGIHLLRGVGFPRVAGGSTPAVVIVNEAMAKDIWPGRDPLGQCLRLKKRDAECYRVIGVAANGRRSSIIEPPQPQYYVPLDHPPAGGHVGGAWVLLVRAGAPYVPQVTSEIRTALHRELPASTPDVHLMSDYIEPQYRPWRLGAELLSGFAILALVVAAIGIYGMVAYNTGQRMHEFGIRVALGARLGNILRLVIGHGLRAVAVGVAAGVVLTLASGRLIASLLYGVTPRDVTTLVAVAIAMLVVAVAAALGPAFRAAGADPATALRAD